jgi:methylated-DNA-[protein]-cysteine S-methyltransferase
MSPRSTSFPIAKQPTVTTFHATKFGDIHATWTSGGLYQLDWREAGKIAKNGLFAAATGEAGEVGGNFQRLLDRYFEGDFSAFQEVAVDRSGWSPFFAKVYKICRAIPAGKTLTYGSVAERAGSPLAARAVGQAMAKNRIPLVIPCHRVLASGGKIGGYSGPGGTVTKEWLLQHEQQGD